MKLIVTLKPDRTRLGVVELWNTAGVLFSAPALGKADNAAAKARGNPTRDPAKPFGDTPLGVFTATVRHFTLPIAEDIEHSYGPYGWITWSVGNRIDLGLHGGDPGTAGRLRPTHGCVRTTNDFMRRLMDVLGPPIETIEVTVREEELPT